MSLSSAQHWRAGLAATTLLVTAAGCGTDGGGGLGGGMSGGTASAAPAGQGSGSSRTYISRRVAAPPVVDGDLTDPAWATVAWSPPFIDIQGTSFPAPRLRTRMKMVWDQEFLFIAAEMEEPHVWATLIEHDSVIFHDNDFEVFIDPDGDGLNYYELEINALNTVWDLRLDRPYHQGGQADNDWEIPGLVTAVKVDGSLNDPGDRDQGWSVELALPWAALAVHARQAAPPLAGHDWRINFSRVRWRHQVVDGAYRKQDGVSADNWVWSPQGMVDMHRPEHWGRVSFTD